MSTTYLYKKNITDIYSAFSKNRKNKLIDVKVTPKDGNNSHKYLGVFQNDDMTYIYADKSSPYPLNDNGINNVSLNINNSTSYNIYSKHSYTYTEGISANNSDIRLFLLAYDYVTNPNNFESLDDQSIKMNSINIAQNAPSHDLVNVYSDITYSIEGNGRTIDVVNEFKLNYNDFKTLLGNKNYVDCTSYIKYSYIQHAVQHDGLVHTDGKQKLTQDIVNQIRDFRVWSFTDGYDKTPYTYTGISDGTPINAYAFINLGNDSQSYFCSQYNNDQKMINPEYVQKTSSTFTPTWLINHNENNKVYLTETGQQYRNFYINAKPYNLSGHENATFMEVCTHPSYRNNNRNCDFYVDIKANSNRSTDALNYQKWVHDNNYNLCKYIKRISLPIHIVNNELTIYLYDTFYYTNEQDVQLLYSQQNTQPGDYETGGDILLYLDFNDPTFNTEFNIKFNCTLTFSNPDNSIYSSGFANFPATTSELLNFHITEVTKKTQNAYPGNNINYNASKSDLYQNKIVFDITTSVNELPDHSSNYPLNNVSIRLEDNHKNNQTGSNISHIAFNDDDSVSSGKPVFYGRVYCNRQFDFHHSPDPLDISDDAMTDGKINFYYLDADDTTSCSMQYSGNYLVPSKLNTSDTLNDTDWPIESLHIFPPFKFKYGNNGSGTNDEVTPQHNTISLNVTTDPSFEFTAFSGTYQYLYIKIKRTTVRNAYFNCSENAYIKFDDIKIGQNGSLNFEIKDIESGSTLQKIQNGDYSGCYYLTQNAEYVFKLITYDDDILYSQGMTLDEFIDYLDNHDGGLTLDIRAKIAKSGESLPTQSSSVINYRGTYVEN